MPVESNAAILDNEVFITLSLKVILILRRQKGLKKTLKKFMYCRSF